MSQTVRPGRPRAPGRRRAAAQLADARDPVAAGPQTHGKGVGTADVELELGARKASRYTRCPNIVVVRTLGGLPRLSWLASQRVSAPRASCELELVAVDGAPDEETRTDLAERLAVPELHGGNAARAAPALRARLREPAPVDHDHPGRSVIDDEARNRIHHEDGPRPGLPSAAAWIAKPAPAMSVSVAAVTARVVTAARLIAAGRAPAASSPGSRSEAGGERKRQRPASRPARPARSQR